jgi:alkane 1-monooxygenase
MEPVAMRYRCPGCGYIYDEARGDPHEGFAPGTAWVKIPADWPCPDCAVNEKADFKRIEPDDDNRRPR